MFENQPKGLWALALANTGERFGYYTCLQCSCSICRLTSVLKPDWQVQFTLPS